MSSDAQAAKTSRQSNAARQGELAVLSESAWAFRAGLTAGRSQREIAFLVAGILAASKPRH